MRQRMTDLATDSERAPAEPLSAEKRRCSRARLAPLFHLILLAIAVVLVYSNTLEVPFQWDEDFLIEQNPLVKDLAFYSNPASAKAHAEFGLFITRYVGFLTLTLNYVTDGVEVAGYHGANIVIHLVVAWLVYFFVLLVLRTPRLEKVGGAVRDGGFAFLVALLFAVHPIQTEAVTYVLGRFATLTALFYLGSLTCYLLARLRATARGGFDPAGYGLLVASVVAAALAMAVKQNAVTLPFVATALELIFFEGALRHRLIAVVPLFSALGVLMGTSAAAGMPLQAVAGGATSIAPDRARRSAFASDYQDLGARRWGYLATQPTVVIGYLRLILAPTGQNFVHDPLVHASPADPNLLAALALLAALLALGLAALRAGGRGDPRWLVAGFGIGWFFVTLVPESSLIPLPLTMAEYRVYLPSVGLFLAVGVALRRAAERLPSPRGPAVAALAVLLGLGLAAHSRNSVWESRLSLWSDVVEKSPRHVSARNQLADALYEAADIDGAMDQYRVSLNLAPNTPHTHLGLARAYARKQMWRPATQHALRANELKGGWARARFNLGNIYLAQGMLDRALEQFQAAVRLEPGMDRAHLHVGLTLHRMGRYGDALPHMQRAVQLDPRLVEAHINLAATQRQLGDFPGALASLQQASRLRPDHYAIHLNLGMVYQALGRTAEAQQHLALAERLRRGSGH
jgi:tetratricopeptide (TPR) repeat protein